MPPQLMQMLPALFAIGARMGGSPSVGTGALQGFQQGQMRLDEQRQQETQQQQRQQQIDLQAQQQATAQEQLAEQQRIQAEQRRQAAINTSADNLRQQKFPTKAAYDQAVAAHETMLGNTYGVRPNTLRAMVPFNGPNVKDEAAKALEPLIREHGFSNVAGMKAVVMIDRDGDGIPERVPVSEAITLAGHAVAMDPETGQPIQAPVKAENVQDFDLVYAGLIDKARAEGKELTPRLKGNLAVQAKAELAKAVREPAATGGAGGGNDAALIDAVLGNPGLYGQLTPTVKTRIAGALSQRGFNFSGPGSQLKPSTGIEKQSLNFFNRAKQASEELERTETQIAQAGLLAQGWQATAPNWLQSAEAQSYTQAQRAFTEARLRKDSGAAIPEHEFANDRRMYFVQPGDDPATVEQKRRSRSAALASMAFTAGNALAEFYGEDAKGLIEGFKKSSTAPGQTQSGGGTDLRAKAKQILQQGGYDASDASIDKFLANPKNRALIGGG
jgi:hypothetical protein